MKPLNILLAGSAMVLASGAAAQSMEEQTADPATTMPAQEAPAQDAPASPAMGEQSADAEFTDTQVKSFAAAVVEIQTLSGDEAAKQQQAAQIVANSGLDAETFNAIGTAMQTDPALAQRVQLAAAEVQSQPAG